MSKWFFKILTLFLCPYLITSVLKLDNKEKNELKKIVEDSLKQAIQYDEGKERLKDSFLSLSGEQQRLCIARIVAMKPQVILMDEPTSALDPIATTKIEELIYILKKGLHDNNCYSQYAASYQNL